MEEDIDEVEKIIPHRPPFLFVDRILEIEKGKKGIGIKKVREDEPYLKGHFPGYPIMPGVLIVESLAQVGTAVLLSQPENKGKLVFFAGIEKFRFKKQVFPGDELKLEVEIIKSHMTFGKGRGVAYVRDEVVGEGQLMFAIVDY